MNTVRTELAPDEVTEILEYASCGASIKDIAEKMGLSVWLFSQLLKRDPILKSRLQQAREIGFTVRAENLSELVQNHIFADANHLRVVVDTEKWILSKLHPAVFGDRIAVQVETVDISGAMQEAKQRALRVINPENVAIEATPLAIVHNPFQ